MRNIMINPVMIMALVGLMSAVGYLLFNLKESKRMYHTSKFEFFMIAGFGYFIGFLVSLFFFFVVKITNIL